jgi:asparagine synthase (glutamine-hydrolysing)
VIPIRRQTGVGHKAHKLAALLSLGTQQAICLQLLSHWNPSEIMPDVQEPDTISSFIANSCWLQTMEDRMMLTDLANYLPDDILTKVDRASMAVGLEARVPMLDHRVVEFAWKLPLHLKIRDGSSKWILRQVLYEYVPAKMIERPKMGFELPLGHWLRGPLRAWAEDLLGEKCLKAAGYFHISAVRNKWQEHLSGVRNWQYLLWDVLMFQAWLAHTG